MTPLPEPYSYPSDWTLCRTLMSILFWDTFRSKPEIFSYEDLGKHKLVIFLSAFRLAVSLLCELCLDVGGMVEKASPSCKLCEKAAFISTWCCSAFGPTCPCTKVFLRFAAPDVITEI
jgi:hypothetical protein